MEQKNSQILYLVLENGRVFRGEPFGAEGEVMCEMVFCHRYDWLYGNANR